VRPSWWCGVVWAPLAPARHQRPRPTDGPSDTRRVQPIRRKFTRQVPSSVPSLNLPGRRRLPVAGVRCGPPPSGVRLPIRTRPIPVNGAPWNGSHTREAGRGPACASRRVKPAKQDARGSSGYKPRPENITNPQGELAEGTRGLGWSGSCVRVSLGESCIPSLALTRAVLQACAV
jgi:hypothetical protein